MTKDELIALFEETEAEFIKFERVENPLHPRRDVCAFLRLHELVPGTGKMVRAAEHDEFFLDCDLEELAKVATKDDVIMLQRCGIRIDEWESGLAMFA